MPVASPARPLIEDLVKSLYGALRREAALDELAARLRAGFSEHRMYSCELSSVCVRSVIQLAAPSSTTAVDDMQSFVESVCILDVPVRVVRITSAQHN